MRRGPKDLDDAEIMYFAGHISGWAEGGGNLHRWAEYNGFTHDEVVDLRDRMRAIADNKTKTKKPTLSVETGWVVVWNHPKAVLEAMTLNDALALNIDAVALGVPADQTILSVWGTQAEADTAIKSLAPHLKAFS